ncbi:hypothetical protein N7456_004547 [Penicillium angulare]|uniref:Complex 1 LYR protein domain-containing protein n=1 Tax=Penicillium angulare TaxID=116970 RepID=A0A9W9FYG3_9EURO|nr:hypothetical protein N7456_004547 [Penicillium angulare]
MHKVLLPKYSGVHRFACLALYRALLRQCTQCSQPAVNAPWLGEIKSLTKQRFNRYKTLQSPSQITSALKAGYQTLDLLHSASQGNKQDEQQIATILAQAKSMKQENAASQRQISKTIPPKPISPREARKQEVKRHEEETRHRHPNAISVLSRPRLNISGKRRVPVLINARGVPFLRLGKPQPSNLSGFIRAKLEKRWDRIVLRDRLQLDILFAEDEDAWDKITQPDTEDSSSWTDALRTVHDDIYTKIGNSDRENREMARKMWNVVLQERKLAAKEEKEREAKDSSKY